MKLAIKGHPERGKEVIKLLEMLGGKNTLKYSGFANLGYYIDPKDQVISTGRGSGYLEISLENFEVKYPYKVGEKILYLNNYLTWIEGIVDKMDWDETNNTLYYHVNNINGTSAGLVTASFLKPMKQKELKDYLKPGYVVEYDDGSRFVITQDVHGNNFGLQIGASIMWDSLDILDYIVKVYQIDRPGALHKTFIHDSHLTLVWEKPKEVELTMQQIADKFGIDVNQLKIKK